MITILLCGSCETHYQLGVGGILGGAMNHCCNKCGGILYDRASETRLLVQKVEARREHHRSMRHSDFITDEEFRRIEEDERISMAALPGDLPAHVLVVDFLAKNPALNGGGPWDLELKRHD